MRWSWILGWLLLFACPVGARAGNDELKKLVAQLASKDESKVQEALAGIAALRREGVPALAAALEDARITVRLGALWHLAKLGDFAEGALDELVAHGGRLGATDAATLGRALFDAAAVEGLEGRVHPLTLLERDGALSESDRRDADRVVEARVTTQAIAAVGRFHPVALLEFAGRAQRGAAPNDFTVPRVGLILALRRYFEGQSGIARAEIAGVVAQAARGTDLELRLTALAATVTLETGASSLEPLLTTALSARDARERAMAAAVFVQWNADCAKRGFALAQALTDASGYVRVFAAAASRRNCGAAPESEQVLVAALADSDEETRIAAIEVLNSMGARPPPRAASKLGDCLKSRNERLLVAACEALAVLGAEAAAERVKIEPVSKHKSLKVRQAAERALERVR